MLKLHIPIGTDIIKKKSTEETDTEVFAGIDMGIFERIAYIMSDAPMKGVSLEDWLSGFEMMDVITALPEIMELWEANTDTQTLTEKNKYNLSHFRLYFSNLVLWLIHFSIMIILMSSHLKSA